MTMTRIVRRTLRERLFSLPWRPLQATKEIPDPTMEHIRKGWAAMPIDRVLDPGRPGRVERQARLHSVPPLRNPGPPIGASEDTGLHPTDPGAQADFATLRAFLENMRGVFGGFRFKDWRPHQATKPNEGENA